MDDLERAHRVREAEEAVASLPSDPEGAASITPHWFHQSRLADGRIIPGAKPLSLLEIEQEAALGPLDLAGRSVLDVGAWNGAFTFAAERRGAARVLATDQWCWLSPVWKGLETFLFLKRNLGSPAEYAALSVDETTLERVGPFDVVLMLGVFYHLPNPLTCLAELGRIARSTLVVETHCDCLDDPLPAMRYYPGSELNGDDTNWWGPNPACMVGLLRNAGFSEVVVREHPPARAATSFTPPRAEPAGRRRDAVAGSFE